MLSISNFGSSSSPMHAYLKSWVMPPVPNQNSVCDWSLDYVSLERYTIICKMSPSGRAPKPMAF